jgi:hypothetical protein
MAPFPDSMRFRAALPRFARPSETTARSWPFTVGPASRGDDDVRSRTFANLGRVVAVTSRSWGLLPPAS